jgi:hypothetical protein
VESEKLCPVCGAYWKCDCKPEEVARVQRRDVERSLLNQAPETLRLTPREQSNNQVTEPTAATTGCNHDWTEALGVEVDEQLVSGETQVLVCRLCGLYSVEERSA